MNAGKEDVDMTEAIDAVPMITRKHFEEAFSNARRSVNATDLYKFDQFRIKMDPAYAKRVGGGSSMPTINWPEDTSSQFQNAQINDDDLYD